MVPVSPASALRATCYGQLSADGSHQAVHRRALGAMALWRRPEVQLVEDFSPSDAAGSSRRGSGRAAQRQDCPWSRDNAAAAGGAAGDPEWLPCRAARRPDAWHAVMALASPGRCAT